MKVFISVPMDGYTDEEIEKNIDRMIEISEVLLKDKERAIYVDNFHSAIMHGLHKVAPNNKHERLYYLGHALQIMADCDAVVTADDMWNHPGCLMERHAAAFYGLEIYEINKEWLYLHKEEERNESWMPADTSLETAETVAECVDDE